MHLELLCILIPLIIGASLVALAVVGAVRKWWEHEASVLIGVAGVLFLFTSCIESKEVAKRETKPIASECAR